ncbi:DUF5719 family protein [Microbacterium sp. XT11]|uniref:DUF5719 family protein n=1 Tax=Microbacterium sp. XT11 TaxID=367477 RepID=UPI00074306EE|nr:DUF5719 family protein [Microbacterium sp. XT11]ALX66697.1 hypothetical protein AB663_002033 [Microbacterium sp. XT11]
MTATRTRAVRVAATSARVLTGAVVAAACVAGTVVALAAPLPGISHQPAQAVVTPPPGDTVLVCNGDFRALGRDVASPLQMQSAEAPRLTVGQSDGEPETTTLQVPDMPGAGQVRRLTAVTEGRDAPLLAATESLSLGAADLTGFAAAPCREARTESWLVGGSVQTGAEDVIVLSNPGAVPATVTLTVFGATRGASTSIVPAGTQVALPLTSIAAGATAPVIKVSATGAPVRAVLQSSLTRTLDPVGVDLQDAVSGPQQHPVIPGVQVFEEEGDSSTAAIVRLLSPDADTSALITVRAVGQTAAATTFPVDLAAGQPLEVSLADLAPGSYTVYVDADLPVLAGFREEDGAGPGSDFAWALPAPEIADDVLVAVPAGPSAALHLVNDEDDDAVVTVAPADGDGTAQKVTVPAGSSASVVVQPRSVVSVSASGPVHAAVAMTAEGALAVWPVWPAAGAEKSITVYP